MRECRNQTETTPRGSVKPEKAFKTMNQKLTASDHLVDQGTKGIKITHLVSARNYNLRIASLLPIAGRCFSLERAH